MGHNTALMVLNDRLDSLEKEPNVGKMIADAVAAAFMNRAPVNLHTIGITVMPSAHADYTQVLRLQGNLMEHVFKGWVPPESNDNLSLLKKLADELGYTLRKKPTKKKTT